MRTSRPQCFRACNKTLLIYLHYLQDDKEGFHIVIPEEEAVDTIVKVFKSSEISNQVRKEVAAIGERVSVI